MAFYRVLLLLCLCATGLVGAFAHADERAGSEVSVRVGIFNSHEAAQAFYEALPVRFTRDVGEDQLWLNAYESASGLTEYYLDIMPVASKKARRLCGYVQDLDTQCVMSKRQKLAVKKAVSSVVMTDGARVPSTAAADLQLILKPLGLRGGRLSVADELDLDIVMPRNEYVFTPTYGQRIEDYSRRFDFDDVGADSPSAQAARAAYETARNNFVASLQRVGGDINAGDDVALAAREEIIALGRQAFEAAGSAYLSGFLDQELKGMDILAEDTNASSTFVNHVRNNLQGSARATLESLLQRVAANALSEGGDNGDVLAGEIDNLMVSGASGVINAGLAAARRSDLYALRHLELDYRLNDFEHAYFGVIATQPIFQSAGLRHNVFLQGGGIINEQSVDVEDDVARHTLNVGAAYRYLSEDEKYLYGANIFFDHQWPYNHSRLGIGGDVKAQNLNLAANYYIPLTDYRESRRDAQGVQYEERALEGYDVEVGYTPQNLQDLSVFGKGYHYFRETDDDLRGMELRAEYKVRDGFTVKGAFVEENGGRDGLELALQYSVPLYDVAAPNIALADMQPAAGSASVRDRIFEKVRRENRIRVEERVEVDGAANVITAQFNALSTGLPFVVGGAATGAGVDLPPDTLITVPNGDFGIINFSNGAIANVSASGGGDVTLEFNSSTLSVLATNGGFVQFISGSGGISTVNVPGGTVNLLGTDIDVTDDGTTTSVQVRAGQINVVADVGAAVLVGNQGDIISLNIASGAMALLVDPARETRQEAAFTSLDLINPAPPVGADAAPFINVLPALVSGPQFVGDNVDVRLTFTQGVSVSGVPFVNGFIDANARSFAYDAGASSATQLVFRYMYVAGDVGANTLTIQGLDLNGGSIVGAVNGLNAITAYTDVVTAITDQRVPLLASSSPVDGDGAFNATQDIVLTFDEDMQANAGNIILTDVTDGSSSVVIPIGDPQVSIAGSVVTINPAGNLDLLTDYDVVIGANVLQDLAGNAFAGIASGGLNFTTSGDVTPPALVSSAPSDNATMVARGSDIVLNFDDNAVIGSGNITIHRASDNAVLETIAVGSGSVTGGGSTTITINPTTDFPAASEVYVLIPSTAFEDVNGNDFAGINGAADLSFRTFSPIDLSNITLWLDGDDIDADGVPEGASEAGLSGGDIATWVDKSGNGNDTVQTNAGVRPSFANPGASFVGVTNSANSGEFMQITNGGASGQTVIAVFEGVAQNVNGNVNAFLDSAGRDYAFMRVAGTDYKYSLDGSNSSQGRIALDGNAFSGVGGNLASPGPFPTEALLYSEYVTILSNHEILGGLSTSTGAVDTTPDFRSNFVLRELIMYSDDKTSDLAGVDEREQIEGYLAHKYGFIARLPAAHPFKSTAP